MLTIGQALTVAFCAAWLAVTIGLLADWWDRRHRAHLDAHRDRLGAKR
jgi:hypothetical protein